jgi:hypothetical protein
VFDGCKVNIVLTIFKDAKIGVRGARTTIMARALVAHVNSPMRPKVKFHPN